MSDEVKWNPEPLLNNIDLLVRRELQKEAKKSIAQIRRSFSQGAVSRPGQPPAVQTGKLSRSLRAFVDEDTLNITVSPEEEAKALALELGAPSRNLRPRPFLLPQKEISKQRLTKAIKRGLKKLGRIS